MNPAGLDRCCSFGGGGLAQGCLQCSANPQTLHLTGLPVLVIHASRRTTARESHHEEQGDSPNKITLR